MSDIVERLRSKTTFAPRGPDYEPYQIAPSSLQLAAAIEIERLRAALKPFAEAAQGLDPNHKDNDHLYDELMLDVCAGDQRRARAALEQKP